MILFAFLGHTTLKKKQRFQLSFIVLEYLCLVFFVSLFSHGINKRHGSLYYCCISLSYTERMVCSQDPSKLMLPSTRTSCGHKNSYSKSYDTSIRIDIIFIERFMVSRLHTEIENIFETTISFVF